VAILALLPRAYLAAQVMDDEMKAVADAERGNGEREHRRVGLGCVGVIDRRRASGKHDADGMEGLYFAQRGGAGKHDGEDIQLANAAGDELGILRSEIEDYDCLGVHNSVWQGWGGM